MDAKSRKVNAKRLSRSLLFQNLRPSSSIDPTSSSPSPLSSAPPPLSTSNDSYSSVTAISFLPMNEMSDSSPKYLAHVTDDFVLEVNPLPPPPSSFDPASPPLSSSPHLRYPLPPGMGDCVGITSYDRTMNPTFSCKLALATASGVLVILHLVSVVGADWNCNVVGVVNPPRSDSVPSSVKFEVSRLERCHLLLSHSLI